MSEYTPGPWKYNPRYKVICGDRIGHLEGPSIDVCEMLVHDKTDANARLVAAAPELLEACKLLLAVYAPLCSPTKTTDAFSSAIIRATHAIAKATGKQPSPESKATEIVRPERS